MSTRYLSAKLFFAFAALNLIVSGIAIGHDRLLAEMYLNPLAWVALPGLVPISEALVSLAFGLLYLFVESGPKRRVSMRLSIAQLLLILLGFCGHLVMVRFWWRVLDVGQPELLPLPIWSTILSLTAFSISFVLFLLNIFAGNRTLPRASQNGLPVEAQR
jgi:hypothetical protein